LRVSLVIQSYYYFICWRVVYQTFVTHTVGALFVPPRIIICCYGTTLRRPTTAQLVPGSCINATAAVSSHTVTSRNFRSQFPPTRFSPTHFTFIHGPVDGDVAATSRIYRDTFHKLGRALPARGVGAKGKVQ
jgi:hypothetical protein